jgi:hypothetical protein
MVHGLSAALLSGMVAQHHPLASAVVRLPEPDAMREALMQMAAWLINHHYTSNPIHVSGEVMTWLCLGNGTARPPWGEAGDALCDHIQGELDSAYALAVSKQRIS